MALIKIEYWNTHDLAEIYYGSQFRQTMFLDAEIIGIDWPVTKEVVEDGDGTEHPTFQRIEKAYSVKFIGIENTCDAIALMQLHDSIQLTTDVLENSRVIDVVMTQELQQNNTYLIELKLVVEYFVASGCGNDMGVNACYAPTCTAAIDRILTSDAIYTDPVNNGVHDGYRYLVVNSGGQGYIYTWSTKGVGGGWIVDPCSQIAGAIAYITGETENQFYDGNAWYPYSSVINAVLVSAPHNYKVTGIAIKKTFIQLQCSTNFGATWFDLEDPTWSESFRYKGITAAITTHGVNLLRVHCYTHNCDYGYSDSYSLTVAP